MLRPFSCQPSAHFRVGAANLMSAMGHKRKWCHVRVMSVIPLKQDIPSAVCTCG